MQIVPSTFIVLALIGLMLARGPYRGLILFMALAPFGMMAAFNLPAVGGTSIVAIDLAVVALFGALILRPGGFADMLRSFAPGGPGLLLLLFLGYATLITLFMPRIFAGETVVFSIGRSDTGIVSAPLRPGGGNLSQLLRMILSVSAFALVFAVIWRRPDPALVLRAMMVATAVHVAMGVIDILTNAAGLAFLLEPIRTANYALTLGQKMAGLNRMIGGFPEASSFGYFTMGMLGFWLSYWFSHRGGSRWPGIFLLMTVFVLLRGTSSSAYVAAAGLGLVFAAAHAGRGSDGRVTQRTAVILVSALAAVPVLAFTAFLLYELVPPVTDFIDRSLLDKLSSNSGIERMSFNIQALRNFVDTYGLGAGLGSIRASNWVAACLGSIGLVGTGLLLAFLLRLLRMTLPAGAPEETAVLVRALKWGCVGFLMRALVVQATPNLHIYFFALAGMGMALVAAAHARRGQGAEPVFRTARTAPRTPLPLMLQNRIGPR